MSGLLKPADYHSPDFPHSDLLPGSEGWLAVAMQHKPTFTEFHRAGENYNTLFRLAHAALAVRCQTEFDEETRSRAFILGVMLYEAVGGLVRPTDYGAKQIEHALPNTGDPNNTLWDDISPAIQNQQQQTPVFAHVIEEVADKYLDNTSLAMYAVGGAAILQSIQLTADELIAA